MAINTLDEDSLAQAIENIQQQLTSTYPDLSVTSDSGKIIIKGSFPIGFEERVLDRYQVRIQWPFTEDTAPTFREIGGRIPWIAERHVNPDGEACLLVPEEWLLLPSHERSVLHYLGEPVRDFLLGQSIVERGGTWPWGERPHGFDGLVQAYEEMLGMKGAITVYKCFDYLTYPKIQRQWDCPCGSGERARRCHGEHLKSLQVRISPNIARSALNRLREEAAKSGRSRELGISGR